jgi:hypothetical protein
MTHPGGGQIAAGTSQIHTLANAMDDISHRMQDVLRRYQAANEESLANQTMGGKYAMQSLVTGAEITDAQTKIQQRFQAINDQLRSGATHYDNMNQQNASTMASVAGHIRFQ